MTDRVAALVRDLEAIPGVYERLAGGDWLEPAIRAVLGDGSAAATRRVVLTGLGSSRFAALDMEHRMRAAGIDVLVETASTDVPVAPARDRLCVAISSSGRTAEVVAAAQRHRGTGPVLAITRDPTSPLAAAADAVVALPVDAEESGIATTTYAATLATLVHVAAALGAGSGTGPAGAVGVARPIAPTAELLAAAAAARATLDSRDAWLPAALDVARSVEALSVLAPWSERGQAEQVALLLREAPRRSADAWETAEWLHIGIYTALPGTVALVLNGSPADAEVARTIDGRSGRVIAVGGGVATDGANAGPGLPRPAAAVIPSPAGLARFIGPALLAAELWRAHTGG